jgi:hypothetical protein
VKELLLELTELHDELENGRLTHLTVKVDIRATDVNVLLLVRAFTLG